MLDRIKEMLYAELEEYAERGELSAGSLDVLHKLTDTIKNIDKIEMLEEEGGYSREGGSYEGGNSGARGGRRGGRHYVRAHYSRDSGSYGGGSYESGDSYAGGSYGQGGSYARGGGYSREDGKHRMMQQMEQLMQQADNDRQRDVIRRCMDQLERIE